MNAGMLQKELALNNVNIKNSGIKIRGSGVTSGLSGEISLTLWKALPNKQPEGIKFALISGVVQDDAISNNTDALTVKNAGSKPCQTIKWVDSLTVNGNNLDVVFDTCSQTIINLHENTVRLVLSFNALNCPEWKGLHLDIFYEIYKGYPVIKKWIYLSNKSNYWVKAGNLILDRVDLKYPYQLTTLLTPAVRGLDPDIVAISDSARGAGIIQVSEVPSKTRLLTQKGITGYHPDFFEWVIGPGESFESDAVYTYAFYGECYQTKSAVSTALDRCVESEFKYFLKRYVIQPFDRQESLAPLFCTWTNYNAGINDSNMKEAAGIASRIGFRCFQLDAGWSDAGPNGGWAVSTIKADTNKFPDLMGICNTIHKQGMKSGLWYSVFINEALADKAVGNSGLFSMPLVQRAGGLGLSFAYDKAREKYVADILFLHKTYGIDYFKQDLSNICYGDIAYGHESRTLKESYLRGLRGFFLVQDQLHFEAPRISLQMSHEIYWETPGPAADVAVLKHADIYHISPNEYWGAGKRSQLVDDSWNMNPDSLTIMLIKGCFRARDMMYAHRGLPLERLEVFGAVTTNYKGSLTPGVQDRQVCSWLMGAPLSFSGDLSSLTEENIIRYHDRFRLLEQLEKKYGIYSCFQYSGVPEPTDTGWHWWGKLNHEGCGAVVVLRGSSGADNQCINIPWLVPTRKYRAKGLFSGQEFGTFTGRQLQEGVLWLSLDQYGQEIIEISLNNNR